MGIQNTTPPPIGGDSVGSESALMDRIVRAIDKMQGLLSEFELKIATVSKGLDMKDQLTVMQKQLSEMELQNKVLSQQIATITKQNQQLKDSMVNFVGFFLVLM